MAASQSLITTLEHLRIVIYFNVAGVALLVFDYFLTLPREISLIWSARWTAIKVLFLLTRYLPFFDCTVFLYYHFGPDNDAGDCSLFFEITAWSVYVGAVLPEVILTLRTWAVWDRDRRFGIGLLVFFGVCWGPVIAIVRIYIQALEYTSITSPPMLGCLIVKGSHIATIGWALLLVYEFGIFLLMLYKGSRHYRDCGMSGLSLVVYRDGLLYYLYLFAFTFANVIVMATVTPDLQVILVLTMRVLHPILGCRAVLDMREFAPTPHKHLYVEA